MLELAVLLRAIQLYGHSAHHLCATKAVVNKAHDTTSGIAA